MALFMDGPVSCMEELTAQDTQLANVASVEGIDVTQKLALAQDEIGLELSGLMEDCTSSEAAVWRVARGSMGQVVVTPA